MIEIQAKQTALVEAVFVQTADDTEYQLIRTAQEAANSGNWIVGECACRWMFAYGKGRTDEAFGELIGLSKDQVFQRRRVWEAFGKIHSRFKKITWTHFREALQWDDAETVLTWAEDCEATVAEMRAWRRAQRGEDLFADSDSGDTSNEQKTEHDDSSRRQKTIAAPQKPEGRTIHRSVESRPSPPPKPPSEQTEPPSKAPLPASEPTADPTTVVAMALRKIDELIGFVVSKGSEEERASLLEHLQPVVQMLSPETDSGPLGKTPLIQAGLAVANTVVNEWNMIDGVLRCRSVTPKRRNAIGVRMKDVFWRENWRVAIDKIRVLKCLHGANDRNWQADIDWFLRPNTVALVIEGKYDNWESKPVSAFEKRKTSNKAAFDEVFGNDQTDESEAVY